MTSAIGPGDWVECLNNKYHEFNHVSVIKGTLYCCERILQHRNSFAWCRDCGNDTDIIVLTEQPAVGWCPCNFRPMRRSTDFQFLIKSTPKEVEPA